MRLAVSLLMLAIAGCGGSASAPAGKVVSEPTSVVTAPGIVPAATSPDAVTDPSENLQIRKVPDFECPVTIPPQPGFGVVKPESVTYSEQFPAPDPWPREYPHDGTAWYGSQELWTALATDGDHSPRKSVWWSANFPGGSVEERPDVTVTWTRLDTDQPVVIDNGGKATNAFTVAEGWFMIAGIDPDEAGCWEVEASYKGATLAYVYERG